MINEPNIRRTVTTMSQAAQSNIFFKLIEERYRRHSTIITTNR